MEHPHQERQKIQEMGCERKEDVHYLMASYSRKGEIGHTEQPTSLHVCRHSASNLDPRSPATPQRKRTQVACERCRRRKIKCSGDLGDGRGCSNCRSSGTANCQFLRVYSLDLPLSQELGLGDWNGQLTAFSDTQCYDGFQQKMQGSDSSWYLNSYSNEGITRSQSVSDGMTGDYEHHLQDSVGHCNNSKHIDLGSTGLQLQSSAPLLQRSNSATIFSSYSYPSGTPRPWAPVPMSRSQSGSVLGSSHNNGVYGLNTSLLTQYQQTNTSLVSKDYSPFSELNGVSPNIGPVLQNSSDLYYDNKSTSSNGDAQRYCNDFQSLFMPAKDILKVDECLSLATTSPIDSSAALQCVPQEYTYFLHSPSTILSPSDGSEPGGISFCPETRSNLSQAAKPPNMLGLNGEISDPSNIWSNMEKKATYPMTLASSDPTTGQPRRRLSKQRYVHHPSFYHLRSDSNGETTSTSSASQLDNNMATFNYTAC